MTGKWGSPAERFERHYMPEPNSGCWLWFGSTNARGYGGFNVDGTNKSAHRVSYELHHNCTVDSTVSVCHRCDNPCCVNPEHLFLGTHQENIADRHRKGRSNAPRGEASGRTSITAEQARAIRSDRRSLRLIAADYGMSISGIHGVRSGLTWKHLGDLT